MQHSISYSSNHFNNVSVISLSLSLFRSPSRSLSFTLFINQLCSEPPNCKSFLINILLQMHLLLCLHTKLKGNESGCVTMAESTRLKQKNGGEKWLF